jgi:hypothetical protein
VFWFWGAHAWRGKGPLPLLRVQFPASRRKALFGETPNATRGTRMLPRTGSPVAKSPHRLGS